MEITEDADPTITRPITHSRPVSARSTVETARRLLPILTPVPGTSALRPGPRCVALVPAVDRPGLGVDRPCRWFAVIVTPAAPRRATRFPEGARAALPGPTPDASCKFPPPRGRS